MKRGTRPRKNRIEVWCDNDELTKIKANAESTMLSNSEFLRNLGKGYEPKSAFDKEAIIQLAYYCEQATVIAACEATVDYC